MLRKPMTMSYLPLWRLIEWTQALVRLESCYLAVRLAFLLLPVAVAGKRKGCLAQLVGALGLGNQSMVLSASRAAT